jgi:ribonucleoside-diphosphate reductase alpha chain
MEDKKGEKSINFKRMKESAGLATRFMDDVIEVAWFPVDKQTEVIKNFRRIGIGVTGWADVLADLGISYTDPKALKLAEKVMRTISTGCHDYSVKLGKEKGPFPYIQDSSWSRRKNKPRNIATNTLPPSSSNAVIFQTSYSIEPYFALAYYQNVLGGLRIKKINPKLEETLDREGIHINDLFEKIFENHGSIQGLKEIPKRIQKLFLTAHEIDWKTHIKMQAAWQKYVDNSITKTINMPAFSTVDDVEKAYTLAWELGCKGITVYRDQSKEGQVFETGSKDTNTHESQEKKLGAGEDCPECGSKLIALEGCVKCTSCSFSYCEV